MVGFVGGYSKKDWTRDIKLAASKGIDGFVSGPKPSRDRAHVKALNCDGGEANTRHLGDAYAAAEDYNNQNTDAPFYLFISADFVHFSTEDPKPLSAFLKPWFSKPAAYKVDGKPFVSTFLGQGTDWEAVAKTVGQELYVVPYYYASKKAADTEGISGLFSW